MKRVIIGVERGRVEVIDVPDGVAIEVRDYDDGRQCEEFDSDTEIYTCEWKDCSDDNGHYHREVVNAD